MSLLLHKNTNYSMQETQDKAALYKLRQNVYNSACCAIIHI